MILSISPIFFLEVFEQLEEDRVKFLFVKNPSLFANLVSIVKECMANSEKKEKFYEFTEKFKNEIEMIESLISAAHSIHFNFDVSSEREKSLFQRDMKRITQIVNLLEDSHYLAEQLDLLYSESVIIDSDEMRLIENILKNSFLKKLFLQKIIRFLESKNLKYVLSIKTNRKIFYKFPNENKSYEHKVSELLTLIKPEQFRPIDIKLSDGSLLRKYFCRMDLKIKGLSGKQRVIIEADTVENISLNDVNFLISNAKELRDDTVVKYYHLRNWIEVFYREVKDCLGADDYQVRSMDKILRHWTLCITTYSMIQWLQFGRLQKNQEVSEGVLNV
jgi:hypothetical protein